MVIKRSIGPTSMGLTCRKVLKQLLKKDLEYPLVNNAWNSTLVAVMKSSFNVQIL